MKRSVGSRELKNRLGTYLRYVREGSVLVVTDRGRPIAELRPIRPDLGDEEAALAGLADVGLLSRPTRPAMLEPFEPLTLRQGTLADTILEDRADRA